jgi:hypothetical protein
MKGLLIALGMAVGFYISDQQYAEGETAFGLVS